MKSKNNSKVMLFSKASGFTLIEALVTLAIVAILLAVGAPSLRSFIEVNKVKAETQRISGLLNLARSTTLTENRGVIFHHNYSAADKKLAIDIYTDDGIAPFAFSAGDEYIQRSETDNIRLFIGDSGAFDDGYLRFTNQGRLVAGEQVGSLIICDFNKTVGRTISVNFVGRVSVADIDDPTTGCN